MNVRAKEHFVLNLERGANYGGHPECAGSHFSAVLLDYDKDGNEHRRLVERELPGALTWLPGETKRNLPDVIGKSPVLRRAVARGILFVVQD
jgi:flavin-dependent dehydrogenase